MLDKMINEISYCPDEAHEKWHDGWLSMARVHLGVVNAEQQPVHNEQQTLSIWMDGEIYGYEKEKEALRAQGCSFQHEQSDAEYVLYLYAAIREEAFAQLNGSFSLVIWDRPRRTIMLVTDRLSSRPLFYQNDREQLIFASHPHAVANARSGDQELDLQAVFEFFTFVEVLGERTYYKDIKMLLPASYLRWSLESYAARRYWPISFCPVERSESYYVEALAEAFRKAVVRRTRGDHRLGILLSGGLDSRCVLAADREARITTAFTLGDSENREVKLAKRIALTLHRDHVFLRREPSHYRDMVDLAVRIGSGMDLFSHAHFLGFLEQIREQADVLFLGWWQDDVVKGTDQPKLRVGAGPLRLELPVLRKVREDEMEASIMRHSPEHVLREQLFVQSRRMEYQESVAQSIREALANRKGYEDSRENIGAYFAASNSAYKHRTALNALCLRHFIPERTVSFDSDLLDLWLETPPRYKVAGRLFKRAQRTIAPDVISIPNSATWLRPDASPWADLLAGVARAGLGKAKRAVSRIQGGTIHTASSWPNFNETIRHDTQLQHRIRAVINSPECLDPDLFDISTANRYLDMHLARRRNAYHVLFMYLTFGVWNQKYGPS